MITALTNLSNEDFSESRERLNCSATMFGVDKIFSFDFSYIETSEFYEENRLIFSKSKGLGYWIWKPYIILETLRNLSEDDILIYSDCGIEIVSDLAPLIDICSNETDILLFQNSDFKNTTWTKRDCFVLMGCDEEKYWDGKHCDAAFALFKKTAQSIKFVEEWLFYACDINVISDLSNICKKENFKDFIEHRRDQSILSILAIKHNLVLRRMPTQFGNHYKTLDLRINNEFNCVNQLNQTPVEFYSNNPIKSNYLQLLNHHRSKKNLAKPIINNTSRFKMKNLIKRLINKCGFQLVKNNIHQSYIQSKKSYSQCGEDLIIDYIFKLRNILNPSYLDIGANHPFQLSNTALFYNRGNVGVNIEANPSLMANFYKNRPNDINLNIGIGVSDEQLDFYVMEDHTLSTFSKDEMESMVKFGKKLKEIKPIKVVPIKTILEAHFNNSPPDLLSIDVEGLDLQILTSLEFEKYAPKIICVEASEYSPIGCGARRNELIDFLKENEYYEYANTNLNAIMVRKDFWFI